MMFLLPWEVDPQKGIYTDCQTHTHITAVRLQSEMEWMGFTMSDLSPATLGYVQALASTATVLGLSNCSDTRYVGQREAVAHVWNIQQPSDSSS